MGHNDCLACGAPKAQEKKSDVPTITNRELTREDKKVIMRHVHDMTSKSDDLCSDGDRNEYLLKILYGKCKYVSDLPDFFREVSNSDCVDPKINDWKFIEVIFGVLSYKDVGRFSSK